MRDLDLFARHQVGNSLVSRGPIKAEAICGIVQGKQICHSPTHAVVVLTSPNCSTVQTLARLTPLVCFVYVESVVLLHSCSLLFTVALIIAPINTPVNRKVFRDIDRLV